MKGMQGMEGKKESEEIPKEMYALISYIGEMKRNHMIMAARIDSLEKDIQNLKKEKIKNEDIFKW